MQTRTMAEYSEVSQTEDEREHASTSVGERSSPKKGKENTPTSGGQNQPSQQGCTSFHAVLIGLTIGAVTIIAIILLLAINAGKGLKITAEILDFSGQCHVIGCENSNSSDCSQRRRRAVAVKYKSKDDKVKAEVEKVRDAMDQLMFDLVEQKDGCEAGKKCPLSMLIAAPLSSGPVQCNGGKALDFPCQNVNLLSMVSIADLCDIAEKSRPAGWEGVTTSKRGTDMWAWIDKEYNQEYVLMGTNWGTSFIRVTDPRNPEVIAFLPTRKVPNKYDIWKDMKVVNNHAFIGSEKRGHGVQIVDLTLLRDLSPGNTKLFTESDVIVYKGVGSSHNIVSNPENNRIFIVGSKEKGAGYNNCNRGGLHILDVTNPKTPKFLGCVSEDGYTHDAQCVIYRGPDTRYQQHEICFSYNENAFTIVDTTNVSKPVILSSYAYTGIKYSHQGWASENFTLNFLDDELDEHKSSDPEGQRTRTYIWDITDLKRPDLISLFKSQERSIDHNLYVKGDYIHQANYQAGYRVLKIDFNSCSLSEVAFFDVYPSSTEAQFAGAWSIYPWLKNGTVAMSTIENGLFLFEVDFDALENS